MPCPDKLSARTGSGPERPGPGKVRPMFRVQGLSVAFGRGNRFHEVLHNVSFSVNPGELIALVGPSGCGKSTLFNVLAGLLQPSAGQIFLEEARVPNLRGAVAYMQQKDLLLPWRSALNNAVLGLEISGVPKKRAREEARKLIAVFGLTGFENHRPDQLSGGMKQRVALLRTILCRKSILLLDEPFSALDAITRRTLQNWFLEIRERFRPTVVLVTHDVDEALILADRIYIMSDRPSASIKEKVDVPRPRHGRNTAPETARLRERLLKAMAHGPEGGAS